MDETNSSNTRRTASAELSFPLNRVRTIMKSSEDTGQITNDVLFIMTRCSELFVQYLAKESYKLTNGDNTLRYEHLSRLVSSNMDLEFLLQIIPEKVTVEEFKQLVHEDSYESDQSDRDTEDVEYDEPSL